MTETEWESMFERMRAKAAGMGATLPSVSTIAATRHDPFRVLVGTLISLRTKDKVTLEASERLFALADTPQAMCALSEEAIARAIYPAGFFQRKAKQIKELSAVLVERYGGKVPADAEKLRELAGVGLKTANLTLNLGFGIPAPCVDCHVHQIANRMGWVRTRTPDQTEAEIRKVMPKRFWIPMNELLVTYGQYVCTPVGPKCSICTERDRCPKIGVTRSR